MAETLRSATVLARRPMGWFSCPTVVVVADADHGMMWQVGDVFYHRTMLRAATGFVRERIRRRGELVPLGFTWAFVVTVDVTMVGLCVIAALQRPAADLPAALIATAVAVVPFVLFVAFGITRKMYEAPTLWAAWSAATAIFLFATSTPVDADFAPAAAGADGGCQSARSPGVFGGLLATASAVATAACRVGDAPRRRASPCI